MRKIICLITSSTMLVCGCGTVIPGPRYKVTVDDFAFCHDGSGVVYLEDRYRYFPLLRRTREKHCLYLYERDRRKHRLIAKADAFSVSPYDPLLLYSPPWKKRFGDRGTVPDFYLLNYRSGERMGFFLPDDFKNDYLSYGLPCVDWEREGAFTAYVNFVYNSGERPSSWKEKGSLPRDWHSRVWKIRIDPGHPGSKVAGAKACTAGELPEISWKDIRRRKFVSTDGRRELKFSKYGDYLNYHSELFILDDKTGKKEYVVKENLLMGIAQTGKYSLYFILMTPLLKLSDLLFD